MTTTTTQETTMNPDLIIYRRELAPDLYEYADSDGYVFKAKSKVRYTHAAWFIYASGHTTFRLCRDENTAKRAPRPRTERLAVLELIDTTPAAAPAPTPTPNVELGRKLYAAMGWA
jgi:hypothetical protein